MFAVNPALKFSTLRLILITAHKRLQAKLGPF